MMPLRLLLTPYANEYRLRTYLGHEDTRVNACPAARGGNNWRIATAMTTV